MQKPFPRGEQDFVRRESDQHDDQHDADHLIHRIEFTTKVQEMAEAVAGGLGHLEQLGHDDRPRVFDAVIDAAVFCQGLQSARPKNGD